MAETNVPLGLRGANGDTRWVLVEHANRSSTPTTTPLSGVVCTFVDFTEQRDAQEALQASEERFRCWPRTPST